MKICEKCAESVEKVWSLKCGESVEFADRMKQTFVGEWLFSYIYNCLLRNISQAYDN